MTVWYRMQVIQCQEKLLNLYQWQLWRHLLQPVNEHLATHCRPVIQ